jgi:hypothetical protein
MSKLNAKQYLWTSAWCVPFFVFIYGYTNWRAKSARQTFSFVFDWELDTPFIPWMILPYVSLNLLLLTPIFFTNPGEIRRLGRAAALATLISGAFFYLLPAPIAFIRPADVPGWNFFYNIVWGLDGVNNTLPSMHIALATLTVCLLWRWLSNAWRGFFVAWMALIFVAVIFTWQHHIMDVVAGFAVGLLSHFVVKLPGDANSFSRDI